VAPADYTFLINFIGARTAKVATYGQAILVALRQIHTRLQYLFRISKLELGGIIPKAFDGSSKSSG
jgi:hypothetical protein